MANRDRDTYVHRLGVTPETASVISSKNKIWAVPADATGKTMYQIGVVATFDPSETRAVEPVRGIGYGDHVAELVPGVTEPMTLAVTRTAQYLSNIFQVFGYKGGIDGIVRSLRHHKWPFDIVNELVLSQFISASDSTYSQNINENFVGSYNSEQMKAILTYFEGCWISDYSTSYASDAALVQENVTVNVTDIVADAGRTGLTYSEMSKDLFNDNAKSYIITSTPTTTPASGNPQYSQTV